MGAKSINPSLLHGYGHPLVERKHLAGHSRQNTFQERVLRGKPMNPNSIYRRLASAGLPHETLRRVTNATTSSYGIDTPVPLRTSRSRMLSSGWLVAQQSVGAFNQILRIYLPGDLIDDAARDFPAADLIALTKAVVLQLPADIAASAGFVEIAAEDALAKTRLLAQHAMRLGRMDAYQRMANFLLEIDTRWRTSDPNTGDTIPFAMKQTDIADYLSMSPVHVNRTMMALRRNGLIEIKPGLRILDYPGLQVAGLQIRAHEGALHLA